MLKAFLQGVGQGEPRHLDTVTSYYAAQANRVHAVATFSACCCTQPLVYMGIAQHYTSPETCARVWMEQHILQVTKISKLQRNAQFASKYLVKRYAML